MRGPIELIIPVPVCLRLYPYTPGYGLAFHSGFLLKFETLWELKEQNRYSTYRRASSEVVAYMQPYHDAFGNFPEPARTIYIHKGQDEMTARHHFKELVLEISYSWWALCIGGYIGSKEGNEEWIKLDVIQRATSVDLLSRIVNRFPQAAYAGFVSCLKYEWEYTTRVVPGIAPFQAPIADTVDRCFLPALFDVPPDSITGDFCICLSHSIKWAGIEVQNSVDIWYALQFWHVEGGVCPPGR